MTQLVIKTDQDRIAEYVTVAEYLNVMNGDIRGMVALVTKTLWNTEANDYYSVEEARKIVGKLTMKQLTDLVKAVTDSMEQTAVPNESEDAYEQD